MLIIMYKCEAKTQGLLSKSEFLTGFGRMGVSSTAGLKAKLPALRKELADAAFFKRFWEWAYPFNCEGQQKSPSLDTVRLLTPMLLSKARFPLLDEWCAFLGTLSKTISKDSWGLLLDFGGSLKADLSGYDAAAAWPVLFDDFVEFVKRRRAGGGAGAGPGGSAAAR